MFIAMPAPVLRLLLYGMLFGAPAAFGQTLGGQPPVAPQPQKAKPAAPAAAPREPVHQLGAKPPPVLHPHGATHPQKPPPPKPPATPAARPAAPPPPVPAEPAKPVQGPDKGSATGLPLPRFAALRSDEVNLRAGPGTRYPIEWIYKRRDLPVQIQREFEVWRLVRDPDGTKGWVHQATLTGRRNFVVAGGDATLRRDAQDSAAAVAILKPGVIGHIRSCPANSDWCQVQVGDYRGFLRRSQFWGTLPGEVVSN